MMLTFYVYRCDSRVNIDIEIVPLPEPNLNLNLKLYLKPNTEYEPLYQK